MAYSDKVLDHYENPRNVGSFDKGDDTVGTGMVGAPACGDVMKLQIKVNPATGLIEDAKFKTFGCGSAIASSSLVTEWVKGKTVDEATLITNKEIAKELSLPPVKIHCSVLAEDAIKAAVADFKRKRAARAGNTPTGRRRASRCSSSSAILPRLDSGSRCGAGAAPDWPTSSSGPRLPRSGTRSSRRTGSGSSSIPRATST